MSLKRLEFVAFGAMLLVVMGLGLEFRCNENWLAFLEYGSQQAKYETVKVIRTGF